MPSSYTQIQDTCQLPVSHEISQIHNRLFSLDGNNRVSLRHMIACLSLSSVLVVRKVQVSQSSQDKGIIQTLNCISTVYLHKVHCY